MKKIIALVLTILCIETVVAEVELLSIIGEMDGKTTVLEHNADSKESNYYYYLMSEFKKGGKVNISYKKISPTKYRLYISSNQSVIPFVFSDSFDKNWKAYIVNQTSQQISKQLINSKEALSEATTKYDNTIADGAIWETWLSGAINSQCEEKPVCVESHNIGFSLSSAINSHAYEVSQLTHKAANSYANSWALDTDLIHNISDKHGLNLYYEDNYGNHYYEIVLEFWPQRLFVLGVSFSIFIFAFCVLYIGIQAYRKSSLENSNLAEYV